MSSIDWLDMGTFLDEAFGFSESRFLGKPLNAFLFLPYSSFLSSFSSLCFLNFYVSHYL